MRSPRVATASTIRFCGSTVTTGPPVKISSASGTAGLLGSASLPRGVESPDGSRVRTSLLPAAEPLRVLRHRRAQRDDVLDRRHDRGGRPADHDGRPAHVDLADRLDADRLPAGADGDDAAGWEAERELRAHARLFRLRPDLHGRVAALRGRAEHLLPDL